MNVRRTNNNFSGFSMDLGIETTVVRDCKTPGGMTQGRGFSDGVRHLWTESLKSCAEVQRAITDFIGIQNKTFDTYKELGPSRIKLDSTHCRAFYDWLKERNPFKVQSLNLHSLSTGLVSIAGRDTVSCDKADDIGTKIQQSFDNTMLTKYSVN